MYKRCIQKLMKGQTVSVTPLHDVCEVDSYKTIEIKAHVLL